MAKQHSSGTSAPSSERHGPPQVAGAGEMPARGPGPTVKGTAGMKTDTYPSDKTPTPQKNVPDRTRGREED